MLILTRKKDQRILINIPKDWNGGEILLTVADIISTHINEHTGEKREARVKIGIHAPPEIKVLREEIIRDPISIPTKKA